VSLLRASQTFLSAASLTDGSGNGFGKRSYVLVCDCDHSFGHGAWAVDSMNCSDVLGYLRGL
jgi:hypothetical protein